MKHLTLILLMTIVFSASAQTENKNQLNALLDQYVHSIDVADSTLGKAFWSSKSEISFINPRGNEYGWNGIRNVYAMFANAFNKRKLQYSNEHWTNYGDVAWVEFNWVFDAVFAHNNKAVQTKGRETQIWHKEKGAWKLVHIHYSGMPVTGQERGF